MKILIILVLCLVLLGCTSSNSQAEIQPPPNGTVDLDDSYFDPYSIYAEPDDNELNWSISELEESGMNTLSSVHYFYSPYCFASNEIKNLTNSARLKYSGRVNWIMHDITTQEGMDEFNYYSNLFNFSQEERVVPLFIYGDKKLKTRFEINETSIENAIKEMEQN